MTTTRKIARENCRRRYLCQGARSDSINVTIATFNRSGIVSPVPGNKAEK